MLADTAPTPAPEPAPDRGAVTFGADLRGAVVAQDPRIVGAGDVGAGAGEAKSGNCSLAPCACPLGAAVLGKAVTKSAREKDWGGGAPSPAITFPAWLLSLVLVAFLGILKL